MSVSLTSIDTYQSMMIVVFQPIILIFGIIGSILNMWLFSQIRFRSNSCSTCKFSVVFDAHNIVIDCYWFRDFFILSINALICLIFGIIPPFYSTITKHEIVNLSAVCKIRAYITSGSLMSCRWLLVMACIDRCLCCSKTMKLRNLATVRMAKRIACLICIVWIIFPIYFIFSIESISMRDGVCGFPVVGMAIFQSIHSILLGGLIPTIILFICSVYIWWKVRQQTIKITAVRPDRQINQRDYQILLILLSQAWLFMILNIPFVFTSLYLTLSRIMVEKSLDRVRIESFVQIIFESFLYIFPSSLFYCSTLLSKTFRSELMRLFRSKFFHRYRQQRRVNPAPIYVLREIRPSLINHLTWNIPQVFTGSEFSMMSQKKEVLLNFHQIVYFLMLGHSCYSINLT